MPLVQEFVEDLEPLVGQADLVAVRIDEQPRHRVRSVLHLLGAELTPDVAGRLRDLGEERLDLWPERLHVPIHPRAHFALPRTSGPSPGAQPGRVVVVVVVGDVGAVGSGMGVVAWLVFGFGERTAGPIGWVAR